MRNIAHCATFCASASFTTLFESKDGISDLCAQVRAMKRDFFHQIPAILTIPAEAVLRSTRSLLLDNDSCGVGEPHRVMRNVCWKKEHLPLPNVDSLELILIGWVDDIQYHGTLVLIKPLGRFVYVVVRAIIWPAKYLKDAC